MRILFMGTPEFAIPSLRILVDHGYDVVGVVTAPDRPAGRGLQLKASPVKEFAVSRGLHVLQPEKLRDPDFIAALQALQPDLAVVVAFRMLPEIVWRMPRLGTFNLHASLLPDYRGAAPLNWALIHGETRTGATTFLLDKEIDTGAILTQQSIDLPDHWCAGDLHDHMMEMGAQLVLKTVQMIASGQYQAIPQALDAQHRPAPKIFKDDCRIDWQRPAKQVYDHIRGLSPYPSAWTTVDSKGWKVFRAAKTGRPCLEHTPGQIRVEGQHLYIACADEWLEILDMQVEGKSRMSVVQFLHGYKGELHHAG
jgi:methionyl-tRNA formyltransferase